MPADIFSLKPLRVLVDRSRDTASGYAVVQLAPAGIFRTSDYHNRVAPKVLRGYDVLGLCGNSTTAYTPGELHMIRAPSSLPSTGCRAAR